MIQPPSLDVVNTSHV